MKKKSNELIEYLPAGVLFAASFCYGGFHEYVSAAVSCILSVYLILKTIKNKRLSFGVHPANILLVLFPFFYLLPAVYSADGGNALFGFVKYLPAALFVLCVADSPETQEHALDILPAAAVLQTAAGILLMRFDSIAHLFSVSGRFSGFFQYSNTYAVFSIAALVVLLTKSRLKIYDYICAAVLAAGVLYSGSRTAAVVMVVTAAATVFTSGNKKMILSVSAGCAVLIAAAGVYAAVSGNFDTVGRFLSISLKESTFIGRLLYWKDGLKVFAAHPFGTGYLGWEHIQHSCQTGVYTVKFIHNDFLQLLLDIGIAGFLCFAAAIIFSFFSKKTSRRKRLIMFAVCSHMFMDFDMEFVSVLLVLCASVCVSDCEKKAGIRQVFLCPAICAAAVFSVWLGISQGLSLYGKYEAAIKVYPYNTAAETSLIAKYAEGKTAKKCAEHLLERNPYSAVACGFMAADAFDANDIYTAAEYKLRQIENAPYEMYIYDEYCRMLALSCGKAERSGDTGAAEFCRSKIAEIPDMLKSLESRTDKLAYEIDDKPSFELNDESLAYIEKLLKEAS